MKRITTVILITLMVVGIWKTGQAVVPPSTALEGERQAETERQRLINIIEKLEHHEEDSINFLRDIRNEMRNLK